MKVRTSVRVQMTELCEPRPVSWPVLAERSIALAKVRSIYFRVVSTLPALFGTGLYILHRGYFLAIASLTFVFFFTRFSTPFAVLGVTPANYFRATHMRVCLVPQCLLFPIFSSQVFSSCRVLNSPLAWSGIATVPIFVHSPFCAAFFWAFLCTLCKLDFLHQFFQS